MGRPCSWPPSPCSTLLWTVPYCARMAGPSKQHRTDQMWSPPSSHRPRPITRPSGGALANDESDAAPNRRTSESDRARYPGPAAATCFTPAHHQAGPPARLALSHSAQGHPQTPQSRSQPGARGTWAAAPPEVPPPVPVASAPCGCCQIPPVLLSLRPAMASPSPIPFQPSPGPVWSLSRSLALSLPSRCYLWTVWMGW